MIIVVAVYVNNNIDNLNITIKCLNRLRELYTENTIVAINNSSLNIDWIDVCKNLNIDIINNEDPVFRYELGAYKLATTKYKSEKYLFLQGSIYLNYKIEESVIDLEEPSVCALKISNIHEWSVDGINFILYLLNKINLNYTSTNMGLFYWCSFLCNNKFLELAILNNIFQIECNTKNHSCAFERILWIFSKLLVKDKNIKQIPDHFVTKYYLKQEVHTI